LEFTGQQNTQFEKALSSSGSETYLQIDIEKMENLSNYSDKSNKQKA